jgi:rod shape determining protein RodA
VLIIGREIQGTRGWYVIGGFSLQPVEFVKLLLILAIGSYLQRSTQLLRQQKTVFVTGGMTLLLIGLILLQPDLGSAIMLFSIWSCYLLLLQAPRWLTATIFGGAGLAFVFGWLFVFAEYQKNRLLTFLDPNIDPLGAGYNIKQSIIAVGAGGLWGRGLGFGSQSQLHFLPEASSDFIFSAIAEEFGFLGVMLLLSSLGLLLWRLWSYARRSDDAFGLVVTIGVFCYLAIQSTLVIGMNIGVLPITGVPLPMVSAGGSSMIASLWMLGVAHRIGMEGEKGGRGV